MSTRRSVNSIDWIAFSTFLAIVVIGWLMLYAASYEGEGLWFDLQSDVGRQTVWIGLSFVVFLAIMVTDWRIWSSVSFPFYIITIVLLLAVLLIGKEVKGATSWFSIMGYTFQPSELAKIGTALAVASFLSQPNIVFNNVKNVVYALAIFCIPAGLIFLQPDAGTALIFMSFLIPLFRAGLNASLYILGLSLLFIFIGSLIWSPYLMLIIILFFTYLFLVLNIKESQLPLSILLMIGLFSMASYTYIDYRFILITLFLGLLYFLYLLFKEGKYNVMLLGLMIGFSSILLSFGTQWAFNNLLKPHQQDRINVWLRPHLCDPQGSLYNIIQSKTAIGSGGFSGKGFLEGTMTKLNYVPEQKTDFIFSILGEEQGFLGSISIIALFTILLLRITIIAERADLPFIRYYAYGVAGIVFFHFFINIGMTIGIMPVIGIPLPLMSKGGSSFLAFTIMIAILLKMDTARVR